jgi:hypothetical protein
VSTSLAKSSKYNEKDRIFSFSIFYLIVHSLLKRRDTRLLSVLHPKERMKTIKTKQDKQDWLRPVSRFV